jgi:hypothetical protein
MFEDFGKKDIFLVDTFYQGIDGWAKIDNAFSPDPVIYRTSCRRYGSPLPRAIFFVNLIFSFPKKRRLL